MVSFWKQMNRESLSLYVCVYDYNKEVQCNFILKSYTMWMYFQKFFSGFIQTMQFVEEQHDLTLKALILLTS